jgi:hypothetical protein
MKALAIVLIALGLVGLIYGGVSWTHREKVVDLGPVEVSHDKRESLPLPPIVGGILLLGGIAMLVSSGRRGHA